MTHQKQQTFRLPPVPQFGATLTLLIAAYSTPVLALFGTPAAPPEHAAHSADAGGEPSGQSPRYTCPMHPAVDSDKPGTCPHCGMKLEEKKEPGPQRVF